VQTDEPDIVTGGLKKVNLSFRQ